MQARMKRRPQVRGGRSVAFQFPLGFQIKLLVSAFRLPRFFPQLISQTLNFFFL
jgi:hypothetical protein